MAMIRVAAPPQDELRFRGDCAVIIEPMYLFRDGEWWWLDDEAGMWRRVVVH